MVKRYGADMNSRTGISVNDNGNLVSFGDYSTLESKHKSAMLTLDKIVELLGKSDTLSISEQVAALQLQVVNLAVENAELKAYRPKPAGPSMMEALDAFFEKDDYPESGMIDAFDILCCKRVQTQATDAAIANFQAQGVDELATFAGKEYQRFVGDKPTQRKWKGIVLLCIDFASQLRKEASNG